MQRIDQELDRDDQAAFGEEAIPGALKMVYVRFRESACSNALAGACERINRAYFLSDALLQTDGAIARAYALSIHEHLDEARTIYEDRSTPEELLGAYDKLHGVLNGLDDAYDAGGDSGAWVLIRDKDQLQDGVEFVCTRMVRSEHAFAFGDRLKLTESIGPSIQQLSFEFVGNDYSGHVYERSETIEPFYLQQNFAPAPDPDTGAGPDSTP